MKALDLGPFPAVEGHDEAVALDEADQLSHHRDRYVRTDEDLIYLDGNSLGRLPMGVVDIIERTTRQEWGDRLIRSWNEGWWDLQIRLGGKLAPLLGAGSGEVMISDSTSVNLYKLAMAAVSATSQSRSTIVTDDLNFPSDVYILESVAARTGRVLEVIRSDGVHGPVDGLAAAIDENTSLVSLSHTVFQSGYTYDLRQITGLAHEAGALVLWDCSHSVGAVPIDFGSAGVDLAVGCTYKHLNGGPGSPAFLFVREGLQNGLVNPIAGWWGHAAPFALELDYRPVEGIRRFHTGTMPIISLAAVEAGIDDVLDATVSAIRDKSVTMTRFLVDQVERFLEPLGFRLASPLDPDHRGSHVSLRHDDAWAVNLALIERVKVIPDFRAPDTIRLGLSPLYGRFIDIHTAVQRTVSVVTGGHYTSFRDTEATVT